MLLTMCQRAQDCVRHFVELRAHVFGKGPTLVVGFADNLGTIGAVQAQFNSHATEVKTHA
jgi:hypothetical protein